MASVGQISRLDMIAYIIVLAFATILLVVLYRRLKVVSLRPIQTFFWWLNYFVVRIWWRLRILGKGRLPERSGAVIVANHRSSVDPCFIEVLVPRVVHWMVAREFCESRLYGWFLRICEVIPTNRAGIDTAAVKQAVRLASAGGLVGVFPEGRINETADLLLPGRPGAVVIALKARVPIIPCYIEGSPYRGTVWSPLITPARTTLTVGEPWDLSEFYDRADDREIRDRLTLDLMKRIAALAGHPDYQPRLRSEPLRKTDGNSFQCPFRNA